MLNSDTGDELLFANNTDTESDLSDVHTHIQTEKNQAWKVMIVDDDEVIHDVSHLVLSDLTFAGRAIQIIDAYSANEAMALINEHPDTALILLDVVMETDHAGLDVVKYTREVAKNKHVRIILRTGQPGNAPEEDIIQNYDINDYKEKTELTARKLHSTVITSLRSYTRLTTDQHTEDSIPQHDSHSRLEMLEKQNKQLLEEIEVHKKINDELIRNELSLQLAQEVANIGHWEWQSTMEDRIHISSQAKKILGINSNANLDSFDSLINKLPSQDQKMAMNAFQAARNNKTDFELTHVLLNDEDKKITLRHKAKCFCDPDGNIVRIVATMQVV